MLENETRHGNSSKLIQIFLYLHTFKNSEFQQLSASHKFLKTDGLNVETLQPPDSVS